MKVYFCSIVSQWLWWPCSHRGCSQLRPEEYGTDVDGTYPAKALPGYDDGEKK